MFTINVIDSGPCHGVDATRTDLNITCNYSNRSDSYGRQNTIIFTITDKDGTYLGRGDTIEEAFGNAASTLINEQFELERAVEAEKKRVRDAIKALKKKGK